ncbi:CsbD family protein [Fundidesulfovibrio soli]|uniref:CsbD family protein n=1 Tax=Fundidesulfovibrio soli TaxID=2922716 RepID=UPI001FAF171A|nr:CsbD family protein [Fundidesulfovibrio soli]
MKSGTKDIVEGTLHQVKGRIKEAAGVLTGDDRMQAEGVTEKISGNIQKKIGHAKKVLDE